MSSNLAVKNSLYDLYMSILFIAGILMQYIANYKKTISISGQRGGG